MGCSLEFLYYLSHTAGSAVNFHKHNCYELVYYIEGRGTTAIGDNEFSYEKNTFTVIQPGYMHDEKHYKKTDVLFIGFKYDGGGISLDNCLMCDDISQRVLKILLGMKKEMIGKKSHYELMLQGMLMELLVEIARLSSVKSNSETDFTQIKNFLDENFSRQIDCNILAELSGYSYHRFRHLFKELYGLSPYQYLMQIRLWNAADMLKSTSFSVSRIALETGFSDVSQFCSLFRKKYGCTPGQFRG